MDVKPISEFLKKIEIIQFAIIFGSTATEKTTNLSDIDIGIFTKKEIPLLKLGRMIASLEKITQKKVDLIVLNELYKNKPNFVYQIVSNSKLLFLKVPDVYIEFKKKVFLYYLDAKPLIDMVNKSFNKRLESSTFGERDYA
jgi:predicted nucleotidyltransferase